MARACVWGPLELVAWVSIHERKKQDTKDLRLFMATKQVLMRIVI